MPRSYLLEEGWGRARLWRYAEVPDAYRVLPPRRFSCTVDAEQWVNRHIGWGGHAARTIREIATEDDLLRDRIWRMGDALLREQVLRRLVAGSVQVLRPLPASIRLTTRWSPLESELPTLDEKGAAVLLEAARDTPGSADAIDELLVTLGGMGRRLEGESAEARMAHALCNHWLVASEAINVFEPTIALRARPVARGAEERPRQFVSSAPITPSGGAKREEPPPPTANPCADRFKRREQVIADARATTAKRASEGSIKPDEIARVEAIAARFEQYNKAMPRAKAAKNVYDTPKKKEDCLTDLSRDPAFLQQHGLKTEDFEDKATGFKAALYRSESDGSLILAAQGTVPNKLVDWTTNIENGMGQDTAQYRAMRGLAAGLHDRGFAFDLAGHSKGGGLASEAGLTVPDASVYTFNSAGLHPASLTRTGTESFESLDARTSAFRTDGDFITFMQEERSPAKQLENAKFLRSELAGEGRGLNPIAIEYRNAETESAVDARDSLFRGRSSIARDVDPDFERDRQRFLAELDATIARAEADIAAGKDPSLFPAARGQKIDIPDSMTTLGKLFGAGSASPRLGKLAQHTMDTVIDSMEANKKRDETSLQVFVNPTPRWNVNASV